MSFDTLKAFYKEEFVIKDPLYFNFDKKSMIVYIYLAISLFLTYFGFKKEIFLVATIGLVTI